MKILFVRHGIAENLHDFASDDLRPLSKEGHQKTKSLAKILKPLYQNLDLLISSPLIRAKETAEYIKKHIDCPYIETESLRHAAEYGYTLGVLKEHEDKSFIAMVGHEPHLSGFISYLLGSNESLVEIKKASFTLIEIENLEKPKAHLLFLIPPKILNCLEK